MKADVENYLNYLEKEMHIMGVLSTFCLAVPALIIERICSLDDKSIAREFLDKLLHDASPYLGTACVLMLVGAALFYKQRSRLAWIYGQMALELAIPNYTGKVLDKRLKEADSWKTWKPYHYAKSANEGAGLGFALAGLSYYCPFLSYHWEGFVVTLIILFIIHLIWICRNTEKHNFDDSIHVPFIG
jgi:hypothetical protein